MSEQLEQRMRVQFSLQNLLLNFQLQNQIPSYMMVDALNKCLVGFQEQSFADVLSQLDQKMAEVNQELESNGESDGETSN